MNRDVIRELVWFATINIGISLAMRAGHALWPEGPFRSYWGFLFIVATILSLNFYRVFVAPRFRLAYAVVAVLNVMTTTAIGNLSFLTSLQAIYLIWGRLI